MHYNFLQFHQSIHSQRLVKMTGLWLVHGDDELVQQWVLQSAKPLFVAHQQLIKRIELVSQKSWQEVMSELQSQSLFSDNTAIIATGKQKITDDMLGSLKQFAFDCQAGDSQNALLWLLPKQDKKSQTTKAFKLFHEYGNILDTEIYNERTRQDLLALKANEFHLQLNDEAWHLLLSHTEGNLLAAHQALWRLSILPNHQMIDAPTLLQALVSDNTYNVFNLSDALIAQDIQLVLKILHELRRLDTAPSLVLWAFAKDIQIVQGLSTNKDPASLGVWQSKIALYEKLKNRLSGDDLAQLSSLMFDTDSAIKGVASYGIWENFQKMAFILCNQRFSLSLS